MIDRAASPADHEVARLIAGRSGRVEAVDAELWRATPGPLG